MRGVAMSRLWRLILLATAFAALLPAHAFAATLPTTHFSILYDTDPTDPASISDAKAADVGTLMEQAYGFEIDKLGFGSPIVTAGDRIPVYVQDIQTSDPGVVGLAYAPTTPTDPGQIALDYKDGLTEHVAAHELFHLIQYRHWVGADIWLAEGTAEWMGFAADGFPADSTTDIGPFDTPLDCFDPGGIGCSTTEYEGDGYSRWPFYEYLSERFGPTIVTDAFDKAKTSSNAFEPTLQGLEDAIAAKGSSLADVYNDWSVANMTGGYTVQVLDKAPQIYGNPILTGSIDTSLPPVSVAVNHLSTRYLAFEKGDNTTNGPCYFAQLAVSVKLPAGVAARPYFWWSAPNPSGVKKAPIPLSIDGDNGTASATIGWDTCDWGASSPPLGYLSLPNPSTNVDAADFVVSSSLQVDPNVPMSANAPPPQVPIHGTTVGSPTTDVAPDIDLYGPELIRLAPGNRVVRLIVQSSGPGQISAALGPAALGTAQLRAGNNDLRFALPASVLRRLRVSAGASLNILTLTSLSPQGASGDVVKRQVLVAAPKAKPKHAAKPKHRLPKRKRP